MSEAIDLVVHCERGPDGPRVTGIVAVEDLAAGPDANQFTVTELFARRSLTELLQATGATPSRLAQRFERAGYDIAAILSR